MGIVSFLALFFLLLNGVSSFRLIPQNSCSSKFHEEHGHLNNSGVYLILHHPRSPCSPATTSPFANLPFSEIFKHDESRAAALSARVSGHHNQHSHHKKPTITQPPEKTSSSNVGVPLNPGTSIGVGNYVTKIGLGTPATDYVMVVDTGSSLSWLQCRPCRVSCHAQVGSIFNPSASRSYRSVSCSTPECTGLQDATLNPSGCSKANVCIYQASYGDSSFSVGYLSKDSLSLGGRQVLPGFVYGCGQDNEGLFGRSAGLIGLAKNKLSLLSQLGSGTFSYCLPSPGGSNGYLSLGPYNPSQFSSFTPMVSSSLDNTLYFLKLTAITVAGKVLPISSSAYSSTPTIIDSGTVITRLPTDVYSGLSKSFARALSKYKSATAFSILDTCYRGSFKALLVPEVSLVFEGGAVLKLAPKNVMIDVDEKTTCLAFAAAGRVAIIGNRQQQTFKVVYDVAKAKIGFAPGGCT